MKTYLGGSKKEEKAILKFNSLTPKQKGEYLMMPDIKAKKTTKGKYQAILKKLK